MQTTMMENGKTEGAGGLTTAFTFFLRIVALFCLASGIAWWARLTGFSEQGAMRFDLVGNHWRVTGAALSVLMPVAAVGLWMRVSWGPVVWVVAAGTEAVMHSAFSGWFGEQPTIVAAHGAVLGTYVAFRFGLWWIARRDKVTKNSP